MNSTKQETPTTVIGIAGASGAGKSRFARQLLSRLHESWTEQDISIVHEDNYYLSQNELSLSEREQINYDHPDAIEHALLYEHLLQLRSGESVEIPQYDYSRHSRRPETKTFNASRVLVIEGILILHDPQIRSLIDLKIFVDVPLDICLVRRIKRDTDKRGRSLASVLEQYQRTVRPMYYQFIEPTKRHADIIVPRGGENLGALDVIHSHLDRLL